MTQLPKHPVVKYLLASYMYYIHDNSIMEDHEFDALAKYLLDNPDVHASHPHGELITKGDLEAGTLLLKHEEYPMVIRCVAKRHYPDINISNEIGYSYGGTDNATLPRSECTSLSDFFGD